MTGKACSISRVTKTFKDGQTTRTVLGGVDLVVNRGSLVGIMGPSGCGKSTLLKIASGATSPDSGSVRIGEVAFDYEDLQTNSALRRDKIGIMSQDYALLDRETVYENVALPLMFGRDRPSRKERKTLVRTATKLAALSVDLERKVGKLSGGERQRVALARALVRTPSLLVVDEPTAALDSVAGGRVMDNIRDVATSGAGVLLATHDPLVSARCDAVYMFSEGKLLQVFY